VGRGFKAPDGRHVPSADKSPEPTEGPKRHARGSEQRPSNDHHEAIVNHITEAARLRSEMIASMKRRLTDDNGELLQQRSDHGGESPRQELDREPPQFASDTTQTSETGPQPVHRSERAEPRQRSGWAPRFGRAVPEEEMNAPRTAHPSRMSEPSIDDAADDFLFSAERPDAESELRAPVWDQPWSNAQNMEHALVKFAEVLVRDQKPQLRTKARKSKRRAAGFGRLLGVFSTSFIAGTTAVVILYGLNSGNGSFQERLAPLVNGVIEAVGTLYVADEDGDSRPAPFAANASIPKDSVLSSRSEPVASGIPQNGTVGKAVETAKLKVADALGDSQNEISLSLSATPADAEHPIDLRITGLPADAMLTRGERLSDGSWILKPGEERDLFLSLPSLPIGEVLVGVEAVEQRTGELAAPPQELRVRVKPSQVVVEPAAESIGVQERSEALAVPEAVSPPPAVATPAVETKSEPEATAVLPVPPPLPSEAKTEPAQQVASVDPALPTATSTHSDQEVEPTATRSEAMIARGDALLAEGDIISARSLYGRAFQLGNARAARPLARTYDPVVLEALGVKGLKADPERAMKWYQTAKSSGEEDAAADIEALQAFLNQ
jgi:hypothetical protein